MSRRQRIASDSRKPRPRCLRLRAARRQSVRPRGCKDGFVRGRGYAVIPSRHRSEPVTVQTQTKVRPYDPVELLGARGDSLTDCFYALLEDEDLGEVFFEFVVAA